MESVCRHCQKRKGNRPRGLCWTCHNNKSIRIQYPSTHPFASKSAKGEYDDVEPTEEELNRIISEQLPTMPEWGEGDE